MKDKHKTAINTLLGSIVAALITAAIWDQLRCPPAERTWYGTVFNVPYNLRVPTGERLRATFGNKDDARVVVPHAPIGMGWSINVYPLLHTQSAH
jgi:hypothetical protein